MPAGCCLLLTALMALSLIVSGLEIIRHLI